MTPEQSQTIRRVLESALDLEPASRPAFLDGACAEPFVRREVESLIAAQELSASFLESPPFAQIQDRNPSSEVTWTAGMKLGPYEIQSFLGADGISVVYRARDTRLDRTVTVKVLPSHLSADPVRKQRFEREARAIAAHFAVALGGQHFIRAFGVPRKTVPQILHLGVARQLRERERPNLDRQIVADLSRSAQESDSQEGHSQPKPLGAGQEHAVR
jgi:serine/threonine protein kinase